MTVQITDLERALYDTWTSDESTRIAGWTLHSNGGFTRRVNCATAVGSPGTDPEAFGAISTWLAERGGAPIVRVTPLLSDETVAAVSTEWGYRSFDDTVVMTGPVTAVASSGSIEVVPVTDEGFFADINVLNQRAPSSKPAWRRLLGRIEDRAAGLRLPGIGVALVAASGRVAEVYSVAVAPDARRRGVASSLMNTATAWAVERGCDTMSLQVLGTNDAALALYDRLGYREVYRYHYLQPQEEELGAQIDGC
ncbi:MAG: GNAT family N-acetyltransferase [Armatimonadetes bacterium]|nr:MAG: GNAT family N-acetyltransferase [Armatimonadota bacterium]